MTRAQFHEIYERTPEKFRAELIGGIVYVASPLKRPHASNHPFLSMVATIYAGHTPGIEVCDNATLFLGDDGEFQPDLFLRVLSEYGGRTRITKDDYIEGPPEWLAEVADSSKYVDLGAKTRQYQRHQVLEYVVMCVKERKLRWFDLQDDKELKADADGIYRMGSFPGLWLHGKALFDKDATLLMQTLEEGMATPKYAAFAKKLADRHSLKKKKK
jgi:Uma2 family endonuclease